MALNNTGFDPEKNMDSLFKLDGEAQLDFETMFDQEDDMIDTIAGLKEDGTPVTNPTNFDALHNEDRDAKPNDFKKTMEQPGGPNGMKNDNSMDKIDPDTTSSGIKGESDFDKWIDQADRDYQKGWADRSSGVATSGSIVTKSINGQVKESIDIDGELDPDAMEDDVIDSIGEEGDLIDYNKNPNPDELEREGKEKSVIGGDSSYESKAKCSCGKSSCPICGSNNDDAIRGGKKPTDGVMENMMSDIDADLDAASWYGSNNDSDLRDGKKPTDGVMEETDPDAELDSDSDSGAGSCCKKETADPKDDSMEDPGEGNEETDDIEEFVSFAEGGVDKDVQNIEDDDSIEDDLINNVDRSSVKKKGKGLSYDYGDDELIDMVIDED